ncbi:properdin-like isoform X1 [Pocillopora verrucosa]|uniref:properdin-like isoform X1 n=1 Tax=Pocillopora verrucosa TaxID=203993 RepID=UPI0033404EE5
MKFGLALYFISMLLIIQPDAILSCDTANWWASLDKKGWSVCPNDRTFLKGLWRNDPSGNNGLWLIEEGKCCRAKEPSYANQPSTCTNANWWRTLDPKHVWALCPAGYYMEGIYITYPTNIYNIEESKCCRPQNHPNAYDDCYDEDVYLSFDKKGWSECKRDGYYMTGIYKGGCEHLYCIEKFKCCSMKKVAVNGGWSEFGPFGECSATCGGGIKERSRTCTNPPPSGGGAQCSGSAKETMVCNVEPCAVNGGWSEFGPFGECSATCGGGIKERSRTCTNPPPSGGGAQCSGSAKETIVCNVEPCDVDGGWTNWSKYGECKGKKCNKRGKMYKYRTCTNPPPSGEGKSCKGKSRKGKRCRVKCD